MIRRFTAGVLFCLAVLPLSFCKSANAQSVKVGFPSISVEFVPLFAAKDKGLFKKYGLDVDAIVMQGGTQVVQALIGGSLDFAVMGGAFLGGAVKGSDLVMVATHMDRFPYSLVVKPDITKVEDLKNKRLGISGFGSTSHAALRLSLERVGLNPKKDVVILQIGGQSARFAALKAGSIDGTIVISPFTVAAQRLGFNVLFNMAKLGISYPQEGVVASRQYISTHRQTVLNFLKGFVEAIRDIKVNKEFAISVMAKHLKMDPKKDREALEDAYQDIVAEQIVKNPQPNLNAIKAALELLNVNNDMKASMDPKRYVDASLMEELEKSGFISSVYK
jgi:NitT/TauT family transport system substrate-binding protein